MSEYTDYFKKEFGVSLEEKEIISFSDNVFPDNGDIQLAGGICAGLCINWIVSLLSSKEFGIESVETEEGNVLAISSFERTEAGMVQKLYQSTGALKFEKHRTQELADHKTLKSIFKCKAMKSVLPAIQRSLNDLGFWQNITNLNGIYYISAKGHSGNHAMAADLRGPSFQFYEPGQYWLAFDSKERFAEVLKGLVEGGGGATFPNLRYKTWGWYGIV